MTGQRVTYFTGKIVIPPNDFMPFVFRPQVEFRPVRITVRDGRNPGRVVRALSRLPLIGRAIAHAVQALADSRSRQIQLSDVYIGRNDDGQLRNSLGVDASKGYDIKPFRPGKVGEPIMVLLLNTTSSSRAVNVSVIGFVR